MEHYLLLARSATYAQRMKYALEKSGIRGQIFRAPRDLTDLGCAYSIRVSELLPALSVLDREKFQVDKVFRYQQGVYREVEI